MSILKMSPSKSVISRASIQTIFVLVVVETITAVLPAGSTNSGQETYFQYINVPGKNEYNFGFNKGNSNHHISRYEQGKNWNFRTKVQWRDKHGGLGEKYWDYNHKDKTGENPEDSNTEQFIKVYSSIEPYFNLEGMYQYAPTGYVNGKILNEHETSTSNYAGLQGSYSNIATVYGSAGNSYPLTDSYGILVGPYTKLDSYRQNVQNGAGAYKIFDVRLKKDTGDELAYFRPSVDLKLKRINNDTHILSGNDKKIIPKFQSIVDQLFASLNIRQLSNGTSYHDNHKKDENDYDNEDESEDDYEEEDEDDEDDFENNDYGGDKTHRSNDYQIPTKRRYKRDEIKVVIT